MTMTAAQETFLALAFGAGLSQLGAYLQRVWQRRDDDTRAVRERTYALEDERLRRQDAACDRLLDLQAQARVLLQAAGEDEVPQDLHAVTEEMDKCAVFIHDERIRTEVEELATVMWWADRIVEVDDERAARDIAWGAANRIGVLAGSVLRREDPPPVPPIALRWRATLAQIEESLTRQPG